MRPTLTCLALVNDVDANFLKASNFSLNTSEAGLSVEPGSAILIMISHTLQFGYTHYYCKNRSALKNYQSHNKNFKFSFH